MIIIPVLDLLDGQVVHAVAGQRDQYRSVDSHISDSSKPLAVVNAFRETFGLQRIYVADLDAIAGRSLHTEVYRKLIAAGFDLLLDAGYRDTASVTSILELGVQAAVIGLETLPSLNFLEEVCVTVDQRRIWFSLDLKNGRPILWPGSLFSEHPLEIVETAARSGIQNVIVLDLADVGTGRGVATLSLCREIHERHNALNIYVGGGVRGVDDLVACREAGASGVLVASALHDDRITPADLDWLNDCGSMR